MTEPAPVAPPPLSLRDQAWRLAACAAISAVFFSSVPPYAWEATPAKLFVEIALGALSFVFVGFRRRWPVAVATSIAAFSAVSSLVVGPATLAAVSVATRRKRGEVLLVGAANAVAVSVYLLTSPFGIEGSTSTNIALTATIGLNIAIMGWGMYIGSRREMVADLEQRALQAEAEQELRLGQARYTERTRIAREMHDVVAHRISLVSLQAGALAFREDLEADRLREGLVEIQTLANVALNELRGVLGVLRDESVALETAPQPTYGDIHHLVEEARATGMDITHVDELGGAEAVPASAGRTLYRIVQEGLTNARKHAPGQALHVLLRGDPRAGITVLLRNPLHPGGSAAPGAGLGLVGLRERAELSGGSLEQRLEDEHFVLEGWLPWQT